MPVNRIWHCARSSALLVFWTSLTCVIRNRIWMIRGCRIGNRRSEAALCREAATAVQLVRGCVRCLLSLPGLVVGYKCQLSPIMTAVTMHNDCCIYLEYRGSTSVTGGTVSADHPKVVLMGLPCHCVLALLYPPFLPPSYDKSARGYSAFHEASHVCYIRAVCIARVGVSMSSSSIGVCRITMSLRTPRRRS